MPVSRSVCEDGKEVEKSSCRDSASLKANAAPVVEISLMGERWYHISCNGSEKIVTFFDIGCPFYGSYLV